MQFHRAGINEPCFLFFARASNIFTSSELSAILGSTFLNGVLSRVYLHAFRPHCETRADKLLLASLHLHS